jgi:exodeoxyribonuclease VII large subunit
MAADDPIFTVTQLNQQVKYLLEHSFPAIMIEGEISNLVQHRSGHWYFSLKDENAQVRSAMFRFQNQRVNFDVKNGLQVLVKAKVSLYDARGDFQLIVESMQEAGAGLLQQQFDALKKRLDAEGLFANTHKKPIPTLPKHIGLITSPTGAAVQDMIRVLNRRMPSIPITVYPCLVQGEKAANDIVNAIKRANTHAASDVILLARGGGSIEDLWAFNEEIVARAIFESKIPIVSGVGHEIDFTIADFVSDDRAATPSAAAEIASPDREELRGQLAYLAETLQRRVLVHFQTLSQQLDFTQLRLVKAHPKSRLTLQTQRLAHTQKELINNMQQHFTQKQHALANLMNSLDLLSPLSTLNRGYAIVSKTNNEIVTDPKQVKPQDTLHVRVKAGTLEVKKT